ncbi:MAG: hypothetical protein OEX82_08055, partial [Nitrosomonas sp.]|nr:hypothetical protein [Nitrosomonas sp.]
ITGILVEIKTTSVVFRATPGIMLVLVYMVAATRVISADTREIMLVTGTSAVITDILAEIKTTSVVSGITTEILVDIVLGMTTIIIVMAIQLHPAALIVPIHLIDPDTIRPAPTQPIRQAILLLPPT